MKKTLSRRLLAGDIESFLSHYLMQGRRQEHWRIDDVEIDDDRLTASVSVQNAFISSTDAHRFHLSIIVALEFLSQLMIIYAHVWSGLSEKSREGWMVESTARNVRAIRNPDRIRVEMTVPTMRKHGDHLYCIADYLVTDDQDGLFEIRIKGFLS